MGKELCQANWLHCCRTRPLLLLLFWEERKKSEERKRKRKRKKLHEKKTDGKESLEPTDRNLHPWRSWLANWGVGSLKGGEIRSAPKTGKRERGDRTRSVPLCTSCSGAHTLIMESAEHVTIRSLIGGDTYLIRQQNRHEGTKEKKDSHLLYNVMMCCTDELCALGHLSSESPVKTSNRQNPQPIVAKRYL